MTTEITGCLLWRNRLRVALAQKGLTQEHASRLMGVSYQHLNRLVKAKHMPSLEMAVRASDVTGWPIQELFVFKLRRRRVRAVRRGSLVAQQEART